MVLSAAPEPPSSAPVPSLRLLSLLALCQLWSLPCIPTCLLPSSGCPLPLSSSPTASLAPGLFPFVYLHIVRYHPLPPILSLPPKTNKHPQLAL